MSYNVDAVEILKLPQHVCGGSSVGDFFIVSARPEHP